MNNNLCEIRHYRHFEVSRFRRHNEKTCGQERKEFLTMLEVIKPIRFVSLTITS